MKKYFKIFLIFSFSGLVLIGQNDIYTITKTMPEFQGGTDALAKYLALNVNYPEEAREGNYSGKSYVNFIVDTNGKVLSPKIIKSSGFKCLDDEAIRAVKSMPKWSPGRDSLKKVNVTMNIPIAFKNLGTLSAAPGEIKLSPEQQEKHEQAMAQWSEGHKLEEQGKFDKALERFNKSLSIETENKYAMFDKGKVHMVLGEKDKACEIWKKMVQVNLRKNEAEEFINKYCLAENGQAEMVKYYNQLKAGDFFNSGMAEVKNGRYEAALRRFDSSLKYNPDHKDALFNKAVMHYKLDQKKAACASWNKLLAMKPDDKEIQDVVKKNCN